MSTKSFDLFTSHISHLLQHKMVIRTEYAILVQFWNTKQMNLHRAGLLNYFFTFSTKNTPVYTIIRQFLIKMSSKIEIWFSDLPKVQTDFWHYFCKFNKFTYFQQKYNIIPTSKFILIQNEPSTFFWRRFFTVLALFSTPNKGAIWAKKDQDIQAWYLFFFVISWFFFGKIRFRG